MRISLLAALIVVAVGVVTVLVFSRGSDARLSEPTPAAPVTSSPTVTPRLPTAHPEAIRDIVRPPTDERVSDIAAAEAACANKDEAAAQAFYNRLSDKARVRISLACQQA